MSVIIGTARRGWFTHTRASTPRQARMRKDRPIEEQMLVAMYIPVEWFVMVLSWQEAPTMRATVKRVR